MEALDSLNVILGICQVLLIVLIIYKQLLSKTDQERFVKKVKQILSYLEKVKELSGIADLGQDLLNAVINDNLSHKQIVDLTTMIRKMVGGEFIA